MSSPHSIPFASLLRSVTRIVLAVLAVGLLAVTIGVDDVSAHGGGGNDATNYRSVVSESGDPGLDWTILGGDVTLQMTNRTGREVIILGYEGEPYLRFTPGAGVFENINSPATYQNQDRYAVTEVPATADPAAPAEWRKVADGDRHGWHDHRIHWMSNTLPPTVFMDPTVEQKVMIWSIPVTVGDDSRPVKVEGHLTWVPSVAWWPPVVVTGIVFALVVAVAAWRNAPAGRDWRGLARPATVVLCGVLLLNVVRVVDDVISSNASFGDNAMFVGLVLPMMVAIGALATRSWRGHPGGFGALALAGLLIMVVFAGENSSQLSAPLLVTELPSWVRRWTVASSYTVMVATSLAALLGGMHYRRVVRTDPAAAERLRRRVQPPID